MHIDARGVVSIVEIVVYIPSFVAAAALCKRHGFGRSSGWIYTLILCLVRIVGACCQLTTYNDHSSGLLKATIIIDSVGVSPLLLATLGLLSRFVDSVNRGSNAILGVKHFRLIQLLISLGLILCIAGGSNGGTNEDGGVQVDTSSKVGIILYIIAYAGLLFVCCISCTNISLAETSERRILLAVIVALPVILVRLAYSALAVFKHDHDFNIVNGSVPIQVAMAVLEEFLVVFIYLFVGFKTEVLTSDRRGPIESRPWKRQRRQQASRGSPGLGA